MKLLFYSTNSSEVELAGRELQRVGVPCEIRTDPVLRSVSRKDAGVELWIKNDRDSRKALVLCVQLRVGFGSPRSAHPLAKSDTITPTVTVNHEEEQSGDTSRALARSAEATDESRRRKRP